MILSCIVFGAVGAAAWYYYDAVYRMMRQKDLQNAVQLGKAMSLAAESALRDRQYKKLQNLTKDWSADQGVAYVAIVELNGDIASHHGRVDTWAPRTKFPSDTCSHRRVGLNYIIVARPVIAQEKVWLSERLAGGVRVVLDTSDTSQALADARHNIIVMAGIVVLCAIPVGYLLVYRVMIQPIRRLVGTTHRLAEGDYDARSGLRRNDETGALAYAFDNMADQVASMRNKLLAHKDHLEREVAQRTEQLQKANDRLCEEMSDKEQFLRAVSHDLNAPMRNIAGMATLIMMKWRDELPEEVTARLQRIQSNVDQQSSLISELMDLSRIRSSPQKRTETDVAALLRSLAGTFEYEIQKRNIELEILTPMPTLWVEENRLRQVFQNLLDNAIKYMHRPVGGRIVIAYRLADQMHEFEVRDNGPGIPADQLERVFVVFRRGLQTAESTVEGKGVGLTVVRTVTSNYDGRAWVRSQEGVGTSFFFTLAEHCTQPVLEEAACGA